MHTNPHYLSRKGVLNQIAAPPSGKIKSKQRGTTTQKQHSVQFETKLIHDVEAWGLTQKEKQIPWIKSKAKITTTAVDAHRKD